MLETILGIKGDKIAYRVLWFSLQGVYPLIIRGDTFIIYDNWGEVIDRTTLARPQRQQRIDLLYSSAERVVTCRKTPSPHASNIQGVQKRIVLKTCMYSFVGPIGLVNLSYM